MKDILMDDEKPFDLRDRIAIEVLNGLVSNANARDGNDTYRDILYYLTYSHSYEDSSAREQQRCAEQRFERIIRNCYKVADIMRKVRLSTFE